MSGGNVFVGLPLVGRPRHGGKGRPYKSRWPRAAATGFALILFTNVALGASAYEQLIAPIFQARCVECHGEQKQKAKLALHTWVASARGSDAGPIWIAGKPGDSVLLQRLRLPLDDEEHMPPKDKPQPAAAEIELLEHWIARGASPTAKIDELGLPPALAAAVAELPAKLAALPKPHDEPMWEFDSAAVARVRAPLAAKVAELQRRFPGALSYESRTSAALHFTAAGLGATFGDADLAALTPVGDELVRLDVSSTSITDASAPVLATFTKLRVLRVGYTRVADETAAAIGGLAQLEVLALNNTAVTEASVGALAKLRGVRALHLAGTPASGPSQAAGLPVIVTADGL